MAGLISNKYIHKSDKLDFSRSIFPYEKRHSTNLLSGYIVPVHHQFLYPGDSPDWNFGCVIESAPLISTNLDNIYVDIVSIWCPVRLVMTDWNEFLGESHTQAFTINRNITIPKLQTVTKAGLTASGSHLSCSEAYFAEHFIGPHIGYREGTTTCYGNGANINASSIFSKGISVLPSRVYELNWNTFFRNENVQAPILIDKTSSVGSHDATYQYGLGQLQLANKLKTWYTIATPSPSLLDMTLDLGLGLNVIGANAASIITFKDENNHTFNLTNPVVNSGGGTGTAGIVNYGSSALTSGRICYDHGLKVDTANLTVNKMYYALMEQRFANKMMKGRRAVEFYQNFFGIESSDAGHDLPQLLVQKRFPLNISQVIATASGSNGTETTDLGQRGAYSVTGFGDNLIHNFTATEHGFIQTYMIIRGQPSIAYGIDKYLGWDGLLDTYIPEFDHIGPVGIECAEFVSQGHPGAKNYLYFGYTNAWYEKRNQVSDVVGILKPGEPLAYKTLALDTNQPYVSGVAYNPIVINDAFLRHAPNIIDRVFMYPVCYLDPDDDGTTSGGVTAHIDAYGEPLGSTRYQFITQFVVKGKFASVMSPDSEPLKLRL